MTTAPPWLRVRRRAAPPVVGLPHTGLDIPSEIEGRLVSPWLRQMLERALAFATAA